MKRILIEWHHYDREETSGKVRRLIARSIETVRPFMKTMQTQLDFREIKLSAGEIGSSGTIMVNGREIERGCCGTLSEERLIDEVLKEAASFAGKGCSGTPEDLLR